jgi:hypothetical protein
MPALPGVLRMDVTYRVGDQGRLIAADLPARRVPVRNEGALYRRVAALATAPDAVIADAATRYGPLGPVGPLAVPDRPGFVLAASRQMRTILDRIPHLRKWIATGGEAAVKGRDALTAHVVAVYAEADAEESQRLIAWLTGELPDLTPGDRARLLGACDLLEEACLTALANRINELLDDLAHPDRVTRVRPAHAARVRLHVGARLFQLLTAKVDEMGPASAFLSPQRLGGLATEFAPYLPDGNVIPADSVDGWRAAATLLARWQHLVTLRQYLTLSQRRQARDGLAAQLQQIDAWPLPTNEILGTYARALWSLWPVFAESAPLRACAWGGCSSTLPQDAHGNRRLCAEHIREADRLRAARNRARTRGVSSAHVA